MRQVLKIIIIFLLMMVMMMVLSISADLLIGFGFKEAIRDWVRPFHVMTVSEKVLYTLLPSIILLQPIISLYKKKKAGKE